MVPAIIIRSPVARALLALALVLVVGCVFHGGGAFFAWSAHRALMREIAVVGMLACGMTVVVVTGGIDLSVGSVVALSAVGVSLLTMRVGWSGPAALVACVAVGACAGATTGSLVAWVRAPPFVASLAMMVFARGLAKLASGGKKVTQWVPGQTAGGPAPELLDALDARVFGAVPVVTLVFLGCVAVTWVVLARLRLGRHLYAVGDNREAARLAGIAVPLTLVAAYALCGSFAALAGVCQAAQETHGDPETGAGYELDAIAMVVVGGTTLAGGRGGVELTLVGALTIGYLHKVLSLNAFSTEARLMLTGAILAVAVLLQKSGEVRS